MSDSRIRVKSPEIEIWENSEGQMHRTNGPAFQSFDKYKAWYKDGKCHRINGPAVEFFSTNNKYWYLNDRCLGVNDKGFWALWDKLTPEQKKDPVLLSHLPGDFNV